MSNEIIIRDEFADSIEINIIAYQLPILNWEIFSQLNTNEISLSNLLLENKIRVAERIKEILLPQVYLQTNSKLCGFIKSSI